MHRHIAFVGWYINAPAGDERPEELRFVRRIICEIGKKYGTIKGSDIAKGMHYIKHKIPNCYGRHIKLMIKSADNTIVRNENDVRYVWRFRKNTYSEILDLLISFIEENKVSLSDDMQIEITKIKKEIRNPVGTYSELLIREPLIGLNTVVQDGNTESRRNEALQLRDKIQGLDKKHNIV